MNVTYDLADEDVVLIRQPLGSSTPTDHEQADEENQKSEVSSHLKSTLAPHTPVTIDSGPRCSRSRRHALRRARSSAKRVRFQEAGKSPISPSHSPAPNPFVCTLDTLKKAGLTPKRVPVKGSIVAATSVASSPAPAVAPALCISEVLQKAGLTPKRVPVKASALASLSIPNSPAVDPCMAQQNFGLTPKQTTGISTSFANSPVPSSFVCTFETLKKAGLTPKRVPVKGSAAAVTSRPGSPTPAGPLCTSQALPKTGLTPRRVPGRGCASVSVDVWPSQIESISTQAPANELLSAATSTVDCPTPLAPAWTREALEKAGLVPRRVPVERWRQLDDSVYSPRQSVSRPSRHPFKPLNERTEMCPTNGRGGGAESRSRLSRGGIGISAGHSPLHRWPGATVMDGVLPIARKINFDDEIGD